MSCNEWETINLLQLLVELLVHFCRTNQFCHEEYKLTLRFLTWIFRLGIFLRVFQIRVGKIYRVFRIRVRKSELENQSWKNPSQSWTVSFCQEQAGKHQRRTLREWWSLRDRPLAKCVHFSYSLQPFSAPSCYSHWTPIGQPVQHSGSPSMHPGAS